MILTAYWFHLGNPNQSPNPSRTPTIVFMRLALMLTLALTLTLTLAQEPDCRMVQHSRRWPMPFVVHVIKVTYHAPGVSATRLLALPVRPNTATVR